MPSERYTKFIDNLCKKEDNIYLWNAEEVSQRFTKKIRAKLKTVYSSEINMFLRELSDRLSDYKILTYDIVKNEVRNRNYTEK